MAINFPHNPNVNDVHTESSLGKSWKWDGTTWLIYSSSTTGIGYSDLSVTTEAAQGGGSLTYNDANGQFTFKPAAGSGGGATNFTGLGDTPSSLNAGKWLKVNTGGTALEWTDAPSGGGGVTYDLVASDGSVVTEEKILLNGSDSSEDAVTLAVSGNLTIARSNNTITFGGSVPTTITVANESTDIECYPLFTTEATGNLAPKTVNSFKLNSSSGQLEAGSFKKTGGSAAEFLKADGSVDSNTYSQSNHTHSYGLNDLSDVTTGTISDGDVLKYSGTNSRWEAQTDATGGGGATTLGALTDVDTTGAVNNKILKYNGTNWVVADDATGGGGGSSNFTGLSDTPSSLTAGKWLKVNAGATALEWTDAPSGSNTTYDLSATASSGNAVVRLAGSDSTEDDVTFSAGGGISYSITGNTVEITSSNSLGGLSDTTISGSPTDNYVLTYDSASSKWEPQPVPSGSTPSLNDVLGAGNTSALAATVGDLTCSNLTVNGTTTTIDSNTVNIGDNILVLNSDEAGTPSQNGGIEIERGTSTNVSLRWNETTDKWQYTNDGTNYSDIGSSTTDTNTTYSISCVDGDNADEEKIRLTDSTSSTDDVVLEAGTGLSIARDGDKITFTNTVSNTTLNLIDEDDMASNSATRPPSQQSVKAYVDANSGGTDTNDYVNTATFSGTTVTLGRTGSLPDLTVDIGSSTVPIGTIVMYNGDTAPAGWCLCDGVTRTINNSSYTPPDLRDKFIVGAGNTYTRGDEAGSADAVVVSHSHGSGNTGNQSANHTHGSGNYSGNASTHNGHTHDDGNYGTNNTGDHYHQQSGSGSGNTGNQSANHYHTIGGNKPDGSPGTFNVSTSGGTHGHSYRSTNGHPQSNMSGISRDGGDDNNSTNNTDIFSTGGSHNHSINLTGVTTAGISENHTHSFNFNIGGNTTYSSTGDHSHNVSGNSGSGGDHSHNVNFSGNSGNQSANHTHSFNVGSEGVSGTGKNLPPYYAITFIIKTP